MTSEELDPQSHPWANGVKACLIHEGMPQKKADGYARILKRAVTNISTFGDDIYDEHTPKRMALARRLENTGYPKGAALVWHDREDRNKVDDRVSGERLYHMYAELLINDGRKH